jgi:osmotically-inducible protein OsmY
MTQTSPVQHRITEQATDTALQRAVRAELEWAPEVDANTIGVSALGGVVHLDGEVRDAAEDARARRAVMRVRGVVGIIDALRIAPHPVLDDAALLDNVAYALRHAAGVPADVRAAVRDGVVVLAGSTTWHAERETARRVVERLAGVRGVRDEIVLTSRPAAADAERRIRDALQRSAALDAAAVAVRVDGTAAIVTGSVRSDAERQQVLQAAWSSPHVTEVDDRLVLAPRNGAAARGR